MTVLLSVQKNSGAIQIDHNALKKQSLRVSFHLGQSDDNQRLGQTFQNIVGYVFQLDAATVQYLVLAILRIN